MLPDNDERVEGSEQVTAAVDAVDTGVTRRTVLAGGARVAALAFLVKIGIFPKSALAQEMAKSPTPTDAEHQDSGELTDEEIEKLAHEPMSLVALDAFGSLAFVDAIVAIAKENDSVAQKLFMLSGIPTYNTGELEDHHQKKFPLENIHLAIILNIIRATSFGPEVRHHTIDEFHTTLMGVALLMGLTSMAKGIVAAEAKVGQMALANEKEIIEDPKKVVADSIFQLTVVASATQLPLTAFGNASIGNGEFTHVKASFDTMYLGLIPNKEMEYDDMKAHIKTELAKVQNPEISARVNKILDQGPKAIGELRKAIKSESQKHANDLMTILMSTACDDAQAAVGDAGPLVGLYQMFGDEFIKAVPAILPYTVLIGFERASFAAKRAGIDIDQVINKEKIAYLGKFVLATWKNLAVYFASVAPKISAKITGSERFEQPNGSDIGRDFTLIEQVAQDIERTFGTITDAMLGSFNGTTLDVRKVKSALRTLTYAERDFKRELGTQVLEKAGKMEGKGQEKGHFPVSVAGIDEVRARVIGKTSDRDELGRLQGRLENLCLGADNKAIETFAAELKGMRAEMGPILEEQLRELYQQEGEKTPSILAVAKILQDNPKIRDLLDFNYWHHKIGAELTDTMFVVFLQGLHLPFIINTVERGVYNNPVFKKMPLVAQECFSVLLNDGVSMFADNWADCVAHSKWLTTMYFNELSKAHEELSAKYPEAKECIDGAYFEDNVSEKVPERFAKRKQQFAALVGHLKSKNPKDAAQLDAILENYIGNAENYYYKTMIMAMTAAVTGGGKAKTGNAPHFTFAAGEDDFTLIETLNDFKRHPLYHVWELIFSTGYAVFVGPEIAKSLFGKSAASQVQKMMQGRFKKAFPEFEKKLNELKSKKDQQGQLSPGDVREKTRGEMLGFDAMRRAIGRGESKEV